MINSSVSGTWSASSGDPWVVRIPAVSWVSLYAIGMPCSRPTGSPPASRSSARAASSQARSAVTVAIALTCGLIASIRSRCARTTSRADRCLCWIRSASWRAVREQMSSCTPPLSHRRPRLSTAWEVTFCWAALGPGAPRVRWTVRTGRPTPGTDSRPDGHTAEPANTPTIDLAGTATGWQGVTAPAMGHNPAARCTSSCGDPATRREGNI